jgi:hypothetical protein
MTAWMLRVAPLRSKGLLLRPGQAGRAQLAAHVPDGRRLQPVAGQAADRERASPAGTLA